MSSLTLLQSLHENLSSRAQVKSVFGEPITAGDKTIIPVAKIAYGFGGGTGSGGLEIKTARGGGGGGGGGVGGVPVGVFNVGPQGRHFSAARVAGAAAELELFQWACLKSARKGLTSSRLGTRRSCLAHCCWVQRSVCSSRGGKEGKGKQCHPERSPPFACEWRGSRRTPSI